MVAVRVVVTGGRDYTDREFVCGALKQIDLEKGADKGLTLICGMARGADALAYKVAKVLGWRIEEYPAKWDLHGKGAGPVRNQAMVDSKPDLCLAFPGGSGTADMVRRCRAAGIPVTEFSYV